MNIYIKFIFVFFTFGVVSCSTVDVDDTAAIFATLGEPLAVSPQRSDTNSKPRSQDLLTLNSFIELALKSNPQIQAARHKWRATAEKYPQAISLPDPMLTYTFFLKEPETRVGPQRHQVSIMQNIPFPKKLYLKGELVKDDTRIALLSYERTIRDVVAKVQQHFYELIYIEKALEITQKNEDLVAQLVKVAAIENNSGNAPLPDLMKAQSQLAQLQYDRIRLRELREVEVGQLNAVLNLDPQNSIELPLLTFGENQHLAQYETFYQYALKNNQEVLAATIAITKADHQLDLAFSEYFPDFSIGASWTQVDKTLSGFNFDFDDDGQDIYGITFGVNLPIWLPKRNARVRESRHNILHAKQAKKDIENQLAAELKKIYYKVSNYERLTKLYRDRLVPEAQSAIEISENWYRDGEKSLLGVLESQSVWLNFSLSLARAQSDYAQGIVTLSQLCGGSLPTQIREEK